MNRIKKTTALLLTLLMTVTLISAVMTGCTPSSGPDEQTSENGTEQSTEGNTEPGNTDSTAKTEYTVEVLTAGGLKIAGANVFVYTDTNLEDDDLGDLDGYTTTDASGKATLSLKPSNNYSIVLTGIPDGYNVAKNYTFNGTSAVITLTSSVIEDPSLSGVSYKLGDVMHDFTVMSSENEPVKLSELLKEKDAVMLNFWYTTCSWCVTEFPYLNSAYERYSDDLEVVALNPYSEDSVSDIVNFKAEYGLSFPMAKEEIGLAQAFGIDAYPTSVMIDRYGVICLIERGAIVSEKPFTALFNHFTGDIYEQQLFNNVSELTPVELPNVNMPSSEEMAAVLNKGDVEVTYAPETDGESAEYSWPFVIGEKEGTACIKPANDFKDSSYATLYANITLKKGDAIAFDYWASSEQGADILYVLVDRKDIYQISGVSDTWKTCYSFVALEDGEYELAFCYLKDESTDQADDTVYIKDLRIVSEADIDIPTYIPRYCATNLAEDGFGYENYVSVVYNEADGYYHVGKVDGPLLLADLMGVTHFSGESVYSMAATGKIVLDGKDYYEDIVPFCTSASNSEGYGLCTVNQELKELLEIVAAAVGIEGHENEWLQMCVYYDAYGTNGAQLADPIRGLTEYSAFEAIEGEGYLNTVTYNRLIMPRGLFYKFSPTKSGAYRITSNTDIPVDGWIFADNLNGYDYDFLFDGGERLFVDLTNCSMVYYFEEGRDYYINIAYKDVYQTGTFTFELLRLGDEYDLFKVAAPGIWSSEDENMGDESSIITLGIDVILGDDGKYHEKRADGSVGSIVYADFTLPTQMFSHSIEEMIAMGAFDFSKNEIDDEILAYQKIYGDETADILKELWGSALVEGENGEIISVYDYNKVDEVLSGKYHGRGKDMTEAIKAFMDKKLPASDETPELEGCVPVDEELAGILQQLVAKYSFGVENAWTKVCYYYQHFGPETAN